MKQGRMGERQRWAWIAGGLSAAMAVKGCGLGWNWVLVGGILVTLYYICMDKHLRSGGLAMILAAQCGIAGRIIAVLVLVWTTLVLGWTALLADAAFPMVEGFPAMGWILLLLAALGCTRGAGTCARCAGVLCLFLTALYGTITGFALPDVELRELSPTGPWQNGFLAMGVFLLPAAVWYVPCRRSRKKAAWGLLLILPVAAALLAAVTAGVLTQDLAETLDVPLYTVAQSVSLFGVVERIEPLLSAAVTMGVFCLLSVQACACRALGKTLGMGKWAGAAACGAAGILMYPARDLPLSAVAVGSMISWFAIPLVLVVKSRKNHKVWKGEKKREKREKSS